MSARPLLIAALLAFSGCAAGGPLPPPGAPGPASGGTLPAADGSTLAVSTWAAERPGAVIIALHGYGDHAESTYARAATHWMTRGITTIAYDQRGFGRNPSRGFWPGADGLVSDLVSVSAEVRKRHPCLPIVVVGHSMGAGVTLAAAGAGLDADALVLATPAIWGGEHLNPFHRLLAWGFAAVVPERRLTGRGVVRIQASDNIEMLRALGRDPLYLRPPSAREIMGLVRITDRAASAAPSVDLPALMLLGAKDQIVPARAVRAVFSELEGPQTVIEYDDGWHLVFRDLQADIVWRDVADWVLAQQSPSGCPEAGRALAASPGSG